MRKEARRIVEEKREANYARRVHIFKERLADATTKRDKEVWGSQLNASEKQLRRFQERRQTR